MRVTAVSRSGVAADVEIDEGVPVAALRARLARLTGDAGWLAGTPTADGEPLHDAHRAGAPPLSHGAVLRPGPGPVPDAVAATRAPLHVAVVGGLDAGALLVPRGPGSLGTSGGLAVHDEGGWLVLTRPARRAGLLVRRAAGGGPRPALAGRPGRHGSRRARRVPRWRWVRWRVGGELRAGASVLVLRGGDAAADWSGAATQGDAGPGAGTAGGGRSAGGSPGGGYGGSGRPASMRLGGRRLGGATPRDARPRGGWSARAARLLPAAAGAATSVALAASLRQPVLLLGALSALALVGPRPPRDDGAPVAAPDDEPADLAALRIALARPAPAEAAAFGARLVGPPSPLPRTSPVPWSGDLAVTGPRAVALACARALLLAALGPGDAVALRTGRPEDWAWLAWYRGVSAEVTVPQEGTATGGGTAPGGPAPPRGTPAVVVLDGAAAAADWCPAARVLRVLDGPAPAWCRTVLAVDRAGARLRGPDGPPRAVPLVGVRTEVAEAMARVAGRVRDASGTEAVEGGAGPSPDIAADLAAPPGPLALGRCPRAVALGALPGVPPPDSRAVARAWRRAGAAPSLRVPLGLGPGGAPTVIDLVADGPHALVAGTTGSGKSELLTTLVVALALAHPPDRLAVLLVDFKGGTGLPALAGLPHVVGRLSDLDAADARRTLRGLSAELRRRERVLAERGASDVRQLDPSCAPPRLLVVIDEFRVLADELPELLPGLARIAAQGRSLGVHLVLATQRPAGAVPADLRANVALRVVLRVADAADGLDLVGTADAARIDRPGLAVLARGAGRPEPVQVARALARAAAPVRLAERWPFGPTPPRETGSPAAVAWTPGAGTARQPSAPASDEGVAAWCAAITAAASGRPRATGPWLPPLPDRVRARDVPPGPGLPLALADLPDDLARGPVRWDPDGGHLLVLGGPGSGRSTALAAVATAAVASGREVHAVGLPARLRPAGLASALDGDDVTRVARLVRLLADARPAGDAPRPVLVLDDVAGALDALAALARGAPADLLAGLWTAAGGPAAVAAGGGIGPATARLAAGFADRLVLGSPDPSADLLAGVPAGLAGARPAPGRAVHLGPGGAALCQVALPDEATSHDGTRSHDGAASPDETASHDETARVGASPRRPSARVVPAVRPLPPCVPPPAHRSPALRAPVGPRGDGVTGLPLGLGGDEVDVVRVDVGRPLLVVGPPGSGRTTALETLAGAAARAGLRVARLPGGGESPADGDVPAGDALLVVDDLDELEARHPALADALAARLVLDGPVRLLAATTTVHAVSAFRGPVPALVRARRLLVLDLAEPGSLDLLGPDGAWLVDPRRSPPGRGALRAGRHVTPVQVFSARRPAGPS